MSRRKLSLIVLALASAALSACSSPTAPSNNSLESCERSGGVMGGSNTRCVAPLSGVMGGSGT